MTRALMPGRWNRDGRAVPDTRNCYISDAEAAERAEAFAKYSKVEDEFSFPALIWWAIVCLMGVASFFAGLLLGSRQ